MEKYLPFPCEGPSKSKKCIAKLRALALTRSLQLEHWYEQSLVSSTFPFVSKGSSLPLPRTGWGGIPARKLLQYSAALHYLDRLTSAVLRATGKFLTDLRDEVVTGIRNRREKTVHLPCYPASHFTICLCWWHPSTSIWTVIDFLK